MSYQSPYTTITRKARIRPEILEETITLPAPPALPDPPPTSILVAIFFSLTAMTVVGCIFIRFNVGQSSVYVAPFIAISGCMALSTLITLIGKTIRAHRHATYVLKRYQKQLQETEAQLKLWQWKERKAYMDLNPPLAQYDFKSPFYEQLDVKPLLQHTFDEQNISLWARRPDDADFLHVRIGIEQRPTTYHIQDQQNDSQNTAPTWLNSNDETSDRRNSRGIKATSSKYAQEIVTTYSQIYAPLLIHISPQSPIGIVGPGTKLAAARGLMHALVGQIIYHHSPEDVRIIILAPRSQEAAWQWASVLPHTVLYDPRQSNGQTEEAQQAHACAIGTPAILDQLPLISRELRRRELLLEDTRQIRKAPLTPHLLIVVDDFGAPGDLDQPSQTPQISPMISMPSSQPSLYRRPRLSISPLKRPEMALALNRGEQLGVSVICTNSSLTTLPPSCQLLIDLSQEELPPKIVQLEAEHLSAQEKRKKRKSDDASPQLPPQAILRSLTNYHKPASACVQTDYAALDDLQSLALRMQSLRAATTNRLEMRTQVDLRTLFDPPLDLANYDPFTLWSDASFRTPQPLLRIPIGLKIGDEIQYLDLIKDGPHGLLIGQSGSGKSELLRTIILALTLAYRPTEVNFLLLDYKAGLTLEPFSRLPHTIEFLSHASSATLIQRFMTMLRAEVTRREILIKEGKRPAHLVIIIDGFTEMAQSTESILDELLTITHIKRNVGIHLLLSAQHLEDFMRNKIRDYVQYRLCLRCTSPEDSYEILRRPDAADLPASIPGRGYLLHGDNQLDLFQSARVTIPIVQEQPVASAQSQLNALLLLPFRGK